jgi:hypothetical protein
MPLFFTIQMTRDLLKKQANDFEFEKKVCLRIFLRKYVFFKAEVKFVFTKPRLLFLHHAFCLSHVRVQK